MTTKKKPGDSLEKKTEMLLAMKGYNVKRNELICGTQIDLIAQKTDLLNNVCFIVECTDRVKPVGVPLVKEKSAILQDLKDPMNIYRLLMVTRIGYTAEAKAFASEKPTILLLKIDELENQLLDFTPYYNWYLHSFENSLGIFKEGQLSKTYVELSVTDIKGTLRPISHEIETWLRDKENNLTILLGEYGAEKTSFCRQFVYDKIRLKMESHPKNFHIPILINLRDVRHEFNLKNVIVDTLTNIYGVQLPSFIAFEYFCSLGKILLVLDGFDEMARKSDKSTINDCFKQIYLLSSLDAKILLTCRSNFFKSYADIIELLQQFSIEIPVEDVSGKRYVQISFQKQGKILNIEKFDSEQILIFLEKRFKMNAKSIYDKIEQIHDLHDLSERPVLLDMICTTLPELIKSKQPINSATLYEHYTNRWTKRDDWRVEIPLQIRQTFCETLAYNLYLSNVEEIPFSVLEELMINSLKDISNTSKQLDLFKNDIQTCSFLVRSGVYNNFCFAHKSFVEFFVAKKLIINLLLKENNQNQIDEANDFLSKESKNVDSRFDNRRGYYLIYPELNYNGKPHYSDYYREVSFIIDRQGVSNKLSEESLRNNIEGEIKKSLEQHGFGQTSKTNISDEIATFAMEHLDNLRISLENLLSKLTNEISISLFSELLRHGKSHGFLKNNIEEIKSYIKTGKNELLRVSFCSALAVFPEHIDFQFLMLTRETLPPDSWNYFLLELTEDKTLIPKFMAQILQIESLNELEKLICLSGVGSSISKTKKMAMAEDPLKKLLDSASEDDIFIGLKFCHAGYISRTRAWGILMNIIKSNKTEEIKHHAIKVLTSIGDREPFRVLRTIRYQIDDMELKKYLKKEEQRILDSKSYQDIDKRINIQDFHRKVQDRLLKQIRNK